METLLFQLDIFGKNSSFGISETTPSVISEKVPHSSWIFSERTYSFDMVMLFLAATLQL